jgi:hypothetical protein
MNNTRESQALVLRGGQPGHSQEESLGKSMLRFLTCSGERIGISKIDRLLAREKKHHNARWFTQMYRSRCAIEAGISMPERQFLLDRVRSPRNKGTNIWAGLAIFSLIWQKS